MGKSSLEEYMARKSAEVKKNDKIIKENIENPKENRILNNELEPPNKKTKLNENIAGIDDVEKGKFKKLQGGLQTQESITREIEIKERKLQKELNDLKKLGMNKSKTIHRDSEGRIIDQSEQKFTNNKLRKETEKEKKINFLNRNEEGIIKEENMRKRLKELKNEGINTYENDSKLIELQKNVIKSEDPALIFDKKVIRKHKEMINDEFISITGRKLFKDISKYPMNRFGMKPGWRWDGIIRGNGFEQKWQDAQIHKK